jgi:hypothetical protein
VHIPNRTYSRDSLLHEFSRRRPMAHGNLFSVGQIASCTDILGIIPTLRRFRSGFAPSLTIQKSGRLCTRMHPSFVPLDHFPPSLSSAHSCSRRDWPSRGRRSVCELCHASVFPSMDVSQMIFTLSVGGGSSCANCTGYSYCMTRRPMQKRMHHRSYGSKRKR